MSSLPNRIAPLLYLVAAGIAALLVGSVVRLASADYEISKNKDALRKIYGAPDQHSRQVSIDDYVSIRPGCFCGRREPEEPPPREVDAPAEAPTGMSAVYVLRGVLVHSDASRSRAFIEVPGVAEQLAYGPGDDVRGAELVSIRMDAVELKRGEETFTVPLRFEDTLGVSRSRRPSAGRELDRSQTMRDGRESGRRERMRGYDSRARRLQEASADESRAATERERQKRERERQKLLERQRMLERTQKLREERLRKQRFKELQRGNEMQRGKRSSRRRNK